MSIVMRIYVGMGAMIALTMLVGSFAIFQTNGLAKTFYEYRGIATSEVLATHLEENLFKTRISAYRFRSNKNPENLQELSGLVAAITDQQAELFNRLDGLAAQEQVIPIPALLAEYEALMRDAVALQQERDAMVANTSSIGSKARLQLSEVMSTALEDRDTEASSLAGLASTNLMLARLYLERFLVDNDPADAERSKLEIENARKGVSRLLFSLQNPERRELAKQTLTDLDQFEAATANVSEIIQTRNTKYARMDEIGPEVLGKMETVVNDLSDRQKVLGKEGAARADSAILIVMAIVAVGTVIGALLAFFTARIISSRLTKITEGMGELADGNLDVDIERSTEKHEIGKMTNAMVVFLENARKARDLDIEVKEKERLEREREAAEQAREAELEAERRAAEERERNAELQRMKTLENFQKDMERVLGEAASGNFSNRMSDSLEDAGLVALAGVINRLLEVTETNIADVVKSIDELAKGNLGIRIEGKREGAFLQMKDDFNTALTTLSATMARIMQSGQAVSATSTELEDSALDMAKRAEDNAAAVEETSAAIEEISASVRQVVTNAKAANEATQKVRESADKSRDISNDTEASINAMTDASEQINSVVKVIEDIAFQINLLALNAGVEAARAGEAGRGFSVVASEVRGLAQRSQEAVQEIGQVIEKNNRSVEVGVEKVARSKQALEGIIADVEVASDQISAIASAVEEQALGIDEVNSAVRSIDGTTQTNAAALEEMTASSVSLSQEASELSETLGQFHGIDLDAGRSTKPKVVQRDAEEPQQIQQPMRAAVGMNASSKTGWEEF
ncbi:methyl-accepting chemotaxis protein [Roseobacter litoralis]|uniref:Methyl-accepting chemotaxis-like protein n=2 Tax=Roseobacter litoralis TaxID=42443 RepID=F7ZB09_ROSLO|nr:methyl-accepting chemotaxis protein [Roseobacter litoralis]AEI95551.1 methyl-accepting chemotaxis-like protein [Roseobacter litoralis Och 149]